MKIRDLENALKYRRIPYPKRSVELIALIAISSTFFLFMHTKSLNTRLREMEVKLQPSEFSALGLSGENHVSGGIAKHPENMNSLHGTYQYLKSTGQLSTLRPNLLNNTKNAEIEILLFNRVAKVGSEALMELLTHLSEFNNFTVLSNPQEKPTLSILNSSQQLSMADKIISLQSRTVYIEHTNWIDFKSFDLPKPIYINLVRDPVERLISWFYFIRGAHRNAIYFNKNPNLPIQSVQWYKKDFNICVKSGDPECQYLPYMVKDPVDNFKRQSLFFCGNDFECLTFNTPIAVQIAKRNVERDYAVVGSWEDTNITLTVLEKYIPSYFRGSNIVYESRWAIILNLRPLPL